MRAFRSWSVAGVILSLSISAGAAPGPVKQGTLAIGAERLSGFFHTSVKHEGQGTESVDQFALLSIVPLSPYDQPRAAIDYFVIDGLSLGGALAFVHLGLENGSINTFLLAPRVGYATFFNDVVGIWPRGGFSYWNRSTDPDRGFGSSENHFAFEIDVPLLLAPAENFWITVGPLIGIPITGSTDDEGPGNPSESHKYTTFGLTAGLTGAF